MAQNKTISCRKMDNSVLIAELLKDPTRSIREIAKELNCTRQAVWRRKKEMEDNNLIWGYTAVIDEDQMKNVMFLILMKMKPMDQKLAEILIRRVSGTEVTREGIRLIDVFQVNGEYDWVVRFSTKSRARARKYYDSLRTVYTDYLLEKPIMVDVNFIMMAEGKRNPHLSGLLEFVPSMPTHR